MDHTIELDVRTLDRAELVTWRLIDIRDPHTAAREPITITAVENIPLQSFNYGIPAQVRTMDRLLISCYHGNSSLMLARWLRRQGFNNVWSLHGGYEALRSLQREA